MPISIISLESMRAIFRGLRRPQWIYHSWQVPIPVDEAWDEEPTPEEEMLNISLHQEQCNSIFPFPDFIKG